MDKTASVVSNIAHQHCRTADHRNQGGGRPDWQPALAGRLPDPVHSMNALTEGTGWRHRQPPGLPTAPEIRFWQEALPVDSSPTSSNVEEVTLTGEELRSWPTLPHTVAFQGVHRGPDPPQNVIAIFLPDTLQLLRDLSSGEKLTPPLELRRLTAGKSRAVYDFQPTRQYLLKLSVPGGHGRELEATQ